MPAPPVRLLTRILSPVAFSTYFASRRAVTSMPPPAGYTTTYSIGCVGKSFGFSAFGFAVCATTGVAITAATARAPTDLFTLLLVRVVACGGASSPPGRTRREQRRSRRSLDENHSAIGRHDERLAQRLLVSG